MKELSYCKILVLTYEKSYFKLVQAHFHIGKEYLKFKCYEQAYNHIQTAIDKNIKATENSSKTFSTQFINSITPTCSLFWENVCTILQNMKQH